MPYKPNSAQYHLARMNDIQKNIAGLLVQGYSNVEAAEIAQVTPQTISNYRNSSLFQAYKQALRVRIEDKVVSNEKMVNRIIPKVLALNVMLVDRALVGNMEDKDAIKLASHWTKPLVELPKLGGSLLTADDIAGFTKKAQAAYYPTENREIEDADVEVLVNPMDLIPDKIGDEDDGNNLPGTDDIGLPDFYRLSDNPLDANS